MRFFALAKATHARRRQTGVGLSYTYQPLHEDNFCCQHVGVWSALQFILATYAFQHPYFKSSWLASHALRRVNMMPFITAFLCRALRNSQKIFYPRRDSNLRPSDQVIGSDLYRQRPEPLGYAPHKHNHKFKFIFVFVKIIFEVLF